MVCSRVEQAAKSGKGWETTVDGLGHTNKRLHISIRKASVMAVNHFPLIHFSMPLSEDKILNPKY